MAEPDAIAEGEPASQGPSLRAVLGISFAVLAGLALVAAVSLVVLTTSLRRSAAHIAQAAHSVRIAEQLEIDLLAHARARDPVLRATRGARLARGLESARQHVGNAAEAALIDRATGLVDGYLAAPPARATDALARAFATLDDLAAINIQQADAEEVATARLDRIANAVGVAVALLLLVGVAVPLVVLRWLAFRPVLRLHAVVAGFSEGRMEARAPETGLAELRQLARGFNRMADALVRQREERFAFLAGVAHDLKNPLTALGLSTAILAPDRPLPDEPHLRELLARVAGQIRWLDRMVGDLLDGARAEAGRLRMECALCDARDLARESAALLSPLDGGHRLQLQLPDAPVPLRCDAGRIGQVLVNLIGNALKHSRREDAVAVAVRVGGGREATFVVSDHGPGIPAADLPHLFEPFWRAPGARRTPGVGLGLAMARRIVEAHGGRIEVESEVGLGTTFRVKLPAAGPAAA